MKHCISIIQLLLFTTFLVSSCFVTTAKAQDDPFFTDQWYLENTGQTGGTPGEDVNIRPIFHYEGTDSVIAIVDDAVEIFHEDLYDVSKLPHNLHFDYVDWDLDPIPVFSDENHGTAVAGIATALRDNQLGITGIAPKAKLVGIRIGNDGISDYRFSLALNHRCDEIDIYNISMLPSSSMLPALEPLGKDTEFILESATSNNGDITSCRGGLGSIFVVSGGNEEEIGGNTNYIGLLNSRYTIAVAATDEHGKQAPYSNNGANILINAPASKLIATTDRTGVDGYNSSDPTIDYTNTNYTKNFSGTSAAAPMVSGIIALMLEANRYLTWRDIQHILIKTAEKNDPEDNGWTANSAGYEINHKYGFGRINAEAAVNAARTWENVIPEMEIEENSSPNLFIPDNSENGVIDDIYIHGDQLINHIEYVEVSFTSDHPNWSDLEITLVSPDGTESILALAEKHVAMSGSYNNWRFGSARHFGENPTGAWSLRVRDLRGTRPEHIGYFNSWTLKIYGTNVPQPCDPNDCECSGTCPPPPPPGGDEIQFTVVVRAKGTPAGNEWPKIVVYAKLLQSASDIQIGEFSLKDTGGFYDDYTVSKTISNTTGSAFYSRGEIKVAFVNDKVVGNEDMNVWIDYIKINGEKIESEGPGVRYHVNPTPESAEYIPGQEAMWWYGQLQFPLDWNFIDIEAVGQYCNGWPQMDAYKNNNANPEDDMRRRVVMSSHRSPGNTRVYRHYVNPGSVHQYYIKYINDYNGSGCDRNLFINSVTFGWLRVMTSDPRVYYLDFNDQVINSGSGAMYWGGRLIFDNVISAAGYVSEGNFPADDVMPDWWEDHYGLDVSNNDEGLDPDSDGLTNLQEYQMGTNPIIADTDNDGMPDGFEVQYGLDPLVNDAYTDLDGDRFVNVAEYRAGTNPSNSDTDGDGMPDLWEFQFDLNPIVNDASNDEDGDGLSNLGEYQNGTDPTKPDFDGDGLQDGDEILTYNTDPLNVDTDGDGYSDGDEVNAGTDPLDKNDMPVDPNITNIALSKPATQSSNNFGTTGAEAVDGNTDGNFANGSVTHTHPDNPSWWQVDLEANSFINEVRVYNRTDCCSERLSNFDVMISEDGETWEHIINVPGEAESPTTVNFGGVYGRYVRVQLTGINYLSLAEVEVVGTIPQETISVTPDSHDFGSVSVDSTSEAQTFTIKTIAPEYIHPFFTIKLTGTDAPEFFIEHENCTAITIEPRDNCTVYVAFSPSSEGAKNAILTIEDNNPDPSTASKIDVKLTGTGTLLLLPEINVKHGETNLSNGGTYDFGAVEASSSNAVTFTIENIGNAQLDLNGSPIIQIKGDDAGDFTVTQHPPSIVDAGSSTSFEITFMPSSTGQLTASVSIPNNDPEENPYELTITGTGTINAYTITASAGDGGSISPSGDVSVNHGEDQTFTITPNDGYHISDVIVDVSSVGVISSYSFAAVTSAHTIEVIFAANDTDNDGLLDTIENINCTDPNDADSDDDGISDGIEDVNQNGIVDTGETDPCNIDTDGDGIQDGTELGYTEPIADPDGEGPLLGTETTKFQPDLDPDITTNPLNPDTDGDGIDDGMEDLNHNGRVDQGESDPNVMPINIYVDENATGNNDGRSWENAVNTIQEGIELAIILQSSRVLVVQGTYVENIILGPGVELLGGYPAGGGERDINAYPTVIDGNGNGHTVVIESGDGIVIDGFTITGGNATGSYPNNRGGGIYIYGDRNSPVIKNCTIVDNIAEYGGGIYLGHTSPFIYHCCILNNTANIDGGGIYYVAEYSYPGIINCLISENIAGNRGGGIHGGDYSHLTNTTIVNNSAAQGGGIYSHPVYTPTIENAIFWNNSPDQIAGGSPSISYSCIQDGYEGDGNISNDPVFEADGYHLKIGSLCIDAGINTATLLPEIDIDGDERILNNTIDMGVDEYNPDTLVLFLPFEDNGGTTTDKSGNGNDGTVNGANFIVATGLGKSNAYEFSWDTADYIEVPYQESQTTTEALTLEAWLYPTAWDNIYAGYNRIVSKQPVYLLRGSNGQAHFNILTEKYGHQGVYSEALTLNQWHYLVGTFDGQTIRLYVDGDLKGTNNLTEPDVILTNERPIHVGESPVLNEGFTGIIDNVAIYKKAKTQEAIKVTWAEMSDDDHDGVPSNEEMGPSGDDPCYDGNVDGLPDNQQDNAVSTHTHDGQSYVTLSTPTETSLSNVSAIENPSPADVPPDVEFPVGFFEFEISGIRVGGAATATLFVPDGVALDTYFKFGPTPDNPTPHWYEFLYDGTTGAEIAGEKITLHFLDGQRGDDDVTANGIVVEPGAPGMYAAIPVDMDGDGVPDEHDACLETALGATVDANGCSGEQLVDLACPCEDEWKNRGEFVSCVAHAAENQLAVGLITQEEKGGIVSARAKSGCGKKKQAHRDSYNLNFARKLPL